MRRVRVSAIGMAAVLGSALGVILGLYSGNPRAPVGLAGGSTPGAAAASESANTPAPRVAYSTFLGGGTGGESIRGIALDGQGNVYVTGETTSTDFTGPTPILPSTGGGDGFVAKLNPTGTAVLWSTFLGGSGQDIGRAIAVDSAGRTWVVGRTASADFPTVSPVDAASANNSGDAFVTQLDTNGAILFSTCLAGNAGDDALAVALDSSGAAYVVGFTCSSDNRSTTEDEGFPILNGLQPEFGGHWQNIGDAFVTKLRTGAIVYSTYLGGYYDEVAKGVAVDGTGNAYVTGWTTSTDNPSTDPYDGFPVVDAIHVPPNHSREVFVCELNDAGSALVFSKFLGGADWEEGTAIQTDAGGRVYVTGNTSSTDFPTLRPLQAAKDGSQDGFIVRLAPQGTSLEYSTFLGGAGGDFPCGIATDSAENLYVGGETSSSNFPQVNPVQVAQPTAWSGAFVTKLDTTGARILYSTNIGVWMVKGFGFGLDGSGNAYIAGWAWGGDVYATARAPKATQGNDSDGFVTKITEQGPIVASVAAGLGSGGNGYLDTFSVAGAALQHARWLRVPLTAYNTANGETRVALGDVDRDGLNEAVVGLGTGGGGWVAVFDDEQHQRAILKWLHVEPPAYDSANGETFPAVGDMDGDGEMEIVLGLGPGTEARIEVFHGASGRFGHRAWVDLTGHQDHARMGGSHPAMGDLDGDGKDDLVVGFGTSSSLGGQLLYSLTSIANQVWAGTIQVPWPAYCAANGATWPALGDTDGDGRAELLVGFGSYAPSGGWTVMFDDGRQHFPQVLSWYRSGWSTYNSANGEIHPALGNLDGDGRADLIEGTGRGGGGWIGTSRSVGRGFRRLRWVRLPWAAYNSSNGTTRPATGASR